MERKSETHLPLRHFLLAIGHNTNQNQEDEEKKFQFELSGAINMILSVLWSIAPPPRSLPVHILPRARARQGMEKGENWRREISLFIFGEIRKGKRRDG